MEFRRVHFIKTRIIRPICPVVFALVIFILVLVGSQQFPLHMFNSIFPQTTTPQPNVVTSLNGVRTSLLKEDGHLVVPNIVHFVWFGEYESMQFHHWLSITSAYKHIKPKQILFHCDHEPIGIWWKKLKATIPILKIIHREAPQQVYNHDILKVDHKSNVASIEILQEYGGIYLETDVIALKQFEPLRRYNFTMGIEYHGNPGRLNNGIIIANKNAAFLKIWHATYQTFNKREWDEHSSILPYRLQFEYPHLIHVEEKTLNYPGGKQLELIYEKIYDWRHNYAIHLWHRLHQFEHGPGTIKKMNNTFGQITRLVYFGSSKLLLKETGKH